MRKPIYMGKNTELVIELLNSVYNPYAIIKFFKQGGHIDGFAFEEDDFAYYIDGLK